MAHIARIDEDGIVREVHVLNNSDLPNDGDFSPETEASANAFQHSLGLEGNWKLTSYNNNFRGRYAGIGYKYDAELDEFIAPEVSE
jgi:peptidoglycan hydrolase-like protein with peptidoglycan-binding domain